jgi:hypothetical protein
MPVSDSTIGWIPTRQSSICTWFGEAQEDQSKINYCGQDAVLARHTVDRHQRRIRSQSRIITITNISRCGSRRLAG